MRLILLYILTINAVAFLCMLLDKLWAKKNMTKNIAEEPTNENVYAIP